MGLCCYGELHQTSVGYGGVGERRIDEVGVTIMNESVSRHLGLP